MADDKTFDIKEYKLEKIRMSIEKIVPKILVNHLRFSIKKSITKDLVYRLEADFAASKEKEIECKYPKDWWEAFKERWAPKWFLKRYPIRYNHEVLRAYTVYPKIPIPNEPWQSMVMSSIGKDHSFKD